MLAILVGLGTWQVQRLHWKQNLLATIDARIHEAPVDIASITDTASANYRHASASGVFQNEHIFYLSAISQKGEGGYDILTPLALADGRFLLVNRGWIPYDRKPDRFFRPSSLVTVSGILRLPEHFWFQPQNDPAHNSWYSMDLLAMAKAANIPAFLPYVLEADDTSNPQDYPVGGQTRVTMPNNHFVYALTWYGMALALLVIYGVSSFRKDAAN